MISTKGITKNLINKYKICNGAKYFSSEMFQNYLVFISAKKSILNFLVAQLKFICGNLKEESIKNITTSDNTFALTLVETCLLPTAKFNGNCLIRNNVYNFRKIINLYISYTLDTWSRDLNTGFTLNNCLFGSVELTKNVDPDKYKHSGYP